jgi:hypothetical protein
VIYGQRTFGSGIFGEAETAVEVSRTISYFYLTLISKETSLPYKYTLKVYNDKTIPYAYITNISKTGIIKYGYTSNILRVEVYGQSIFGENIFGGKTEEENLATKTIRYSYITLISKEANVLYNWGIGIEKDKDILYSYKALIPFIGELPYRFTLITSKTKDIIYSYGSEFDNEYEILYSYKGSIIRIRTIRYGYRSLKSLFEGTVRKITITATPKGQVAKIELERR